MRTKKVFWAVAITALVVAIILISLEAYYVVAAFLVGLLLMGYREIWSLLRRRKMPPIDERVRENTGKSVRNGFIFFMVATALLMLPFSVRLVEGPDTVQVLGGLFIAAGAVYLLSYLYYDRVETGLSERSLRLFRTFMLIAGISLGVAIISIFLHNAIYGLFIQIFGVDFWERVGMSDEPVFFIIATMVSPLGFAIGFIGSLVIYFRGLFRRSP
jgi:MFS family permease